MEFYRIGPPRVAGGNASAAGSTAPKPRCGAGRAASTVLYRSATFVTISQKMRTNAKNAACRMLVGYRKPAIHGGS